MKRGSKTNAALSGMSNNDNLLPFKATAAVAAHAARKSLPVLVVLHQENSTPGRIGNVLGALGLALDIRRPRFGDRLPETLDEDRKSVV